MEGTHEISLSHDQEAKTYQPVPEDKRDFRREEPACGPQDPRFTLFIVPLTSFRTLPLSTLFIIADSAGGSDEWGCTVTQSRLSCPCPANAKIKCSAVAIDSLKRRDDGEGRYENGIWTKGGEPNHEIQVTLHIP